MRWIFYLIGVFFVILGGIFVSAGDIIFDDGNFNITEDLYVNANTLYVDSANDRVGIGTTSPDALVHLAGTGGGLTTALVIEDTDGPTNKKTYRQYVNNDQLYIDVVNDAFSSATDLVSLNLTSGNVGIGQVIPIYPFEVLKDGTALGTAASVGLFRNAAGTLGTHIGYDASGGAVIASVAADRPIAFWAYTGGAYGEKMRITSAGNVGIGLTSPNSTLHIVAGGTTLASSWDVYSDPSIKADLVEQNINNFDFSTAKLYSYNLKWGDTTPVVDENGTIISESTEEKISDRTQLGLVSTDVPQECVRKSGDIDAVDTYCLLSLAYVKIAQLETRIVALGG